MSMARVSSGLAYPDRFYAAASYAGFDGSPSSSVEGVTSKFSNDSALLLYALYQQVNFLDPMLCRMPYRLSLFLTDHLWIDHSVGVFSCRLF